MSRAKTTTTDDLPWQARAKCFGLPPSLFVPSTPGGTIKPVLDICWGRDGKPICPVRAECEAFGEENDEVGVWGGKMRSASRRRMIVVEVEIEATVQPIRVLQDARPKKVRPTE